jgi:hypothetical protein
MCVDNGACFGCLRKQSCRPHSQSRFWLRCGLRRGDPLGPSEPEEASQFHNELTSASRISNGSGWLGHRVLKWSHRWPTAASRWALPRGVTRAQHAGSVTSMRRCPPTRPRCRKGVANIENRLPPTLVFLCPMRASVERRRTMPGAGGDRIVGIASTSERAYIFPILLVLR